MMGKIKRTFTLDEDLAELLDIKIDNKSGLVNDLLKVVLFGEDEEEKILAEIEDLSKKLKVKKNKLCKIRDKKRKEEKLIAPVEKVLKWAEEVSPLNEITGERKPLLAPNIRNVCKNYSADCDLAVSKLKKLGYNILG